MNPMNLLKTFVNGGGSPQEFIKNAMGSNSNPMISNLMNMAKSGNKKDVENFARNYCKERGKDFDKEFADFMNQVNGK